MTISKWKGIAATEAFYAFFRVLWDYISIDSIFISWHFPLIMDRLRLLEVFTFITAHLKSSCRRFSSFSMCDFYSEITVTSSIKAFIYGTVFLLVVSLVLRSNIPITKTKVNGEITQPIIIPIWRCPWCSRYRLRKWTRRHEFKFWTRLIAFHIALIPLGEVWIQLFSLQLWVNSRTD